MAGKQTWAYLVWVLLLVDLVFLASAWQLFGFVERYGNPASAVKSNKENQKLSGLQNFLLTLQQGPDTEGEFRLPALVHLQAKGGSGASIYPCEERGEADLKNERLQKLLCTDVCSISD